MNGWAGGAGVGCFGEVGCGGVTCGESSVE